MTDLASELKLPDLVLSEQLLLNANLTEDQRLMIRTVVGDKMSFDKIAEELVNQHPRIQEKNQYPSYTRRHDFKGYYRPMTPKGTPKGVKGKAKYFHSYYAEGEHDDQYEYEPEESYAEEPHDDQIEAYYGAQDDYLDVENFTFAEEQLAFLADGGLDLENQEACDFASEIIQAEQEAYFARKGAQSKGHSGFRKGGGKPPPF